MKTKTLFSSVIVIFLCLVLVVGGTYAIFTDDAAANIAITSGEVNVTAQIDPDSVMTSSLVPALSGAERYVRVYGGVGGYMGTTVEAGKFVGGGDATLNSNGTLVTNGIMPGDMVEFTVTVDNRSDVDIQYRTRISVDGHVDFLRNLIIRVNGERVSSNNSPLYSSWGDYAAGTGEQTIAVSVELDIDADEGYTEKSCSVIFAVEAVQGNYETENSINLSSNELYWVYDGQDKSLSFYARASSADIPMENPNGDTVDHDSGLVSDTLIIRSRDQVAELPWYPYMESLESVHFVDETASPFNTDYWFYRCARLKTVSFPDNSLVDCIGFGMFAECTSLESIVIPTNVRTIDKTAFANCTSLSEVTFEDGESELRWIRESAFFTTAITEITIPKTVEEINGTPFYSCNDLESIIVEEGNPVYAGSEYNDCIYEKETGTLIVGIGIDVSVPEGVTEIGHMAYSGRDALQTITFPSTLTEIEPNAFLGCSSLSAAMFAYVEGNTWSVIDSDGTVCYVIGSGQQAVDNAQLLTQTYYNCTFSCTIN